MRLTEQILAPLSGNPLAGLRRTDQLWQNLKDGSIPIPSVVKEHPEPLGAVDWDVIICGGTLGILMGCALAQRGWRVALLERGILRGREQEWNISRKELATFVELGLLSEAELEQAIATEFNPVRVQFHGGSEIWARDVLNVGIDPVFLLATLKEKFLAAGGHLLENTAFVGVGVHPDGVKVESKFLETDPFQPLFNGTTRLLIDAMGHGSPLVQQARQGQKPDSVCLVVGSCAQGFPSNESGDLIVSFTPLQNQCQYFWEAFPARDGRTTYLFTYLDAHPDRPSLESLFEDYLQRLPEYQGVELSQLKFIRALFGFFPCYRHSPLHLPWNRLLPVGDSSGSQSPLSFGGFGAMVRHLQRLTLGVEEALQNDSLSRQDLALLQPYQPSLAVTWLFQKTMSARIDQKLAPNHINQLLCAVFQEMAQLGEPVLRPFLQDVVQFSALSATLMKTALMHPMQVVNVIPHVGLPALLDWMVHYLNLGTYSVLYSAQPLLEPWLSHLSPQQQFRWHRWLDAWKYGSGKDYR
jgi:lycopene cyclase CruP